MYLTKIFLKFSHKIPSIFAEQLGSQMFGLILLNVLTDSSCLNAT